MSLKKGRRREKEEEADLVGVEEASSRSRSERTQRTRSVEARSLELRAKIKTHIVAHHRSRLHEL